MLVLSGNHELYDSAPPGPPPTPAEGTSYAEAQRVRARHGVEDMEREIQRICDRFVHKQSTVACDFDSFSDRVLVITATLICTTSTTVSCGWELQLTPRRCSALRCGRISHEMQWDKWRAP